MAKELFKSLLTLDEADIVSKIDALKSEAVTGRFGKKVDTKDTSFHVKNRREIARCFTALNQIRSSK